MLIQQHVSRALAVNIVLITCLVLPGTAAESSDPNRYLNAVRTFADNVVKYGRDTYGPKHTPLFVDGLNIHTREPVKWIAANGHRWTLCNLASQQNLFRTLDGLTRITGDPQYKQAAMDAIKYAFENLRGPNGLLYWGNVTAFDVRGDEVFGWRLGKGYAHCLKANLPYYNLMWEVDPNATKQFIEAFWSAHILDWSNLDMNRWSNYGETIEHVGKVWKHEYKGGPVFFENSRGGSFLNTGADLICAAAWLTKLSGEKESTVWAKRLAHRYVRTRHPKTGISYGMYTKPRWIAHKSYDDVMRKLVPGTVDFLPSDFPWAQYTNPIFREATHGQFMPTPGIFVHKPVCYWQSQFLVGELLGGEGGEFKQWALEELTAYGKASYRKKHNAYVPILTDGTSLEGYVVRVDGPLGPKGVTLEPLPARPSDYWAYTMAYRVTKDEFMWEMAHSIAKGNGFGDIGAAAEDEPKLNLGTDCSDPYAVLAFLELYRATGKSDFLKIARKVGNNILGTRFHEGFFLVSDKHIYTKFDAIDSLALLHLHLAPTGDTAATPQVWPSLPYLVCPYRRKDLAVDNTILYMPTESSDPPISLNEAAAMGRLDIVKSLIAEGADIDNKEDGFFKTPLDHAVINGHKDVVELLLAKGADINARDHFTASSLHYAIQRGHTKIAEVLIAGGADVDVKDRQGQTPLDIAVRRGRKDIVELLQAKVADSSIHGATSLGVMDKVKAFVEQGIDINEKDGQGMTPLHLAAQAGHREIVEFLLSNDADVHAKDSDGRTPLEVALSQRGNDIVKLLVEAGADIPTIHMAAFVGSVDKLRSFIKAGMDIDTKDEKGRTPLLRAIMGKHIDAVEFLINNGADVNTRDEQGYVPLVHALWTLDSDIVKLLLEKGVDVQANDTSGYTPLHWAVMIGSKELTELILDAGGDVNAKSRTGETPLDLAKQGGPEIVELLRKHGAKEYDRELLQAAADGDAEKVKLLLSEGADLNVRDWRGTALHVAAQNNRTLVANLLLTAGGNVDARHSSGGTPLHWAAVYGHKEIAELLIKRGADVRARDSLGHTPLHSASSGGHRDVAEMLIAKEAEVNARQNEDLTALHKAAKWGHPDVAELLISKGADIEAQDKDSRTALWYAKASDCREIVELLSKGKQVHDVAAVDISVTSPCTQGDCVSVGVNVVNRSDYSETLAVILTDVTDSATIGTTSVHLSPVGIDGMDEIHDMIFPSPTTDHDYFGAHKDCGGDVNADGYNDLVITAAWWDNGRGWAHLYYSGPNMATVPDVTFEGEHTGDRFGQDVCLADVNGDGYADVIIGAVLYNNEQGRVYVYYGGPDMDSTCDLTLTGEVGTTGRFGRMVKTGDVNNDSYDDVLVSAPFSATHPWKGRAYLYYGGSPMDSHYDKVFEGEFDKDGFGLGADIGGDVDGDGYRDVLIGATGFPGRKPEQGRAYLYYGDDEANMNTTCDLVFACPESGGNQFGYVELFDIDSDGHADVLIGARFASDFRGQVYLYWGDTRENMDSIPDKIFTGEEGASPNLGGNAIHCGRFNKDSYGDIAVAAYNWYRSNHTGRVYVYYGGTKTSMDESADKILTGVLWSRFGAYFSIGDVNNDTSSSVDTDITTFKAELGYITVVPVTQRN
ncbi:MAG: ankyrin repeat domain-containing protein [Planctomycetota bacterium]|jgi:pectate lyase